MRVLITGGAGFIGSNLAFWLRSKYPDASIVAFDNLHRRGSEQNAVRFPSQAIEFVHGDIRQPSDLEALSGEFDVIFECSAEPSVHAGVNGSARYVLDSNLVGTLNCLEFARKKAEKVIFLSTSRVYSIQPLKEIQLEESATRFTIKPEQFLNGISTAGISEQFPTHLPRSLYGATKLASEMIIQEYVDAYKLKALVNRCGVVAGPGQFGKTDQGVFTYWVVNHFLGKPLTYTGFGGTGKQVRDLVHPLDLCELLGKQMVSDSHWGEAFNVGGGVDISVSLRELTDLSVRATGRKVPIGTKAETAAVDVPLFICNSKKVQSAFDWVPSRSVEVIVEDIVRWASENRQIVDLVFQ